MFMDEKTLSISFQISMSISKKSRKSKIVQKNSEIQNFWRSFIPKWGTTTKKTYCSTSR